MVKNNINFIFYLTKINTPSNYMCAKYENPKNDWINQSLLFKTNHTVYYYLYILHIIYNIDFITTIF